MNGKLTYDKMLVSLVSWESKLNHSETLQHKIIMSKDGANKVLMKM